MTTTPHSTRPAIALRNQLSSLRPMRNDAWGTVSWDISADCRFWASLEVNSLTHMPLIGVCLPSVMDRVDQLLQRSGMQIGEPVDRTRTPVCAIPLDALLTLYLPEKSTVLPDFGALHADAPLTDESTQWMVETLLRAESILIDVAADLRSFVDWASEKFPYHPGMEFSLPVACHLLGHNAEARSFIDMYRARIQAMGNRGYAELYERYVEELAHEFSAGD